MHIILGIVLVLTWLYWWLRGHWFACVVGTIVLVPAFACGGGVLAHYNSANQFGSILGAIAGGCFGWLIAYAPVRFFHHYD